MNMTFDDWWASYSPGASYHGWVMNAGSLPPMTPLEAWRHALDEALVAVRVSADAEELKRQLVKLRDETPFRAVQ